MASAQEEGGGRKRDRTPEKPGKGKQTAKVSPDDPRCAICLEKVTGDLGVLPCGHVFCYECIRNCATKTATACPVCRRRFDVVKQIFEHKDVEENKPGCAYGRRSFDIVDFPELTQGEEPQHRPDDIAAGPSPPPPRTPQAEAPAFQPMRMARPARARSAAENVPPPRHLVDLMADPTPQEILRARYRVRVAEGQAAMARSRQASRTLRDNEGTGQENLGAAAEPEAPPEQARSAPRDSILSQQPPPSAGIAPTGRYRVAAVPPLAGIRAASTLHTPRAAAAIAAAMAGAPGAAPAPMEGPPPPMNAPPMAPIPLVPRRFAVPTLTTARAAAEIAAAMADAPAAVPAPVVEPPPVVEEPPPPVDAPPVAPVPPVPRPRRFTAPTMPTARAAAAMAAAMAAALAE